MTDVSPRGVPLSSWALLGPTNVMRGGSGGHLRRRVEETVDWGLAVTP